jgi:hypothetical protein
MSLPRAKIKEQMIEGAKTNHLVSYLCHKSGISRATFYRWVEEDKTFAREIENAQELGRCAMCDLAESKLLQLVKSPNENVAINASKYLLRNNHKNYKESNWGYSRIKLEEKIKKLKSEEENMIEEALDGIKAIIKQGQEELKTNK